jgi:hypothetical protein
VSEVSPNKGKFRTVKTSELWEKSLGTQLISVWNMTLTVLPILIVFRPVVIYDQDLRGLTTQPAQRVASCPLALMKVPEAEATDIFN